LQVGLGVDDRGAGYVQVGLGLVDAGLEDFGVDSGG
jgi:hypothetical protein